ncbi:MAG: D-alanyl-D-alanine carboxypeptidase family protein [Gallionella sp.]
MKFILSLLIFCLPAAWTGYALSAPLPEPPKLAAKSWLLYDFTGDRVLVNHDGNKRLEPASLTKLMTAYLTFDAIKRGTLTLNQKLDIPATAIRRNRSESRMLLKTGQTVTVNELLRGLIVQSGNDAAIALAISVASNVDDFVKMMNDDAKRLGMKNTHFANPTGLPDDQHFSTAYDIALLASAILRDYPQYYPIFGLRNFTFNNITQANRNRLLWLDPYADGMKSGHTKAAGYCLVGSAKRGDHRLISVVMGAVTNRLRATESQKLLNYGFQNFDSIRLYTQNDPVTTLRIWKGMESMIALGFRKDLFLTIPKGSYSQLKATIKTSQPLIAPVSGGQQLGLLNLTLSGEPYAEFPLVALEKVQMANVFSRGWDSLQLMFE